MFYMRYMTYHTMNLHAHVQCHLPAQMWLYCMLAHKAGMLFTGTCFVTCLLGTSRLMCGAIFFNVVVVVPVVVFIILLGESQQTGLLLGTLGGFLYYGQRERAMLLDDSRMEAHSTDLLPEKK